MDKFTIFEIMLTGLTTVAAAFFGSMWAHKFAINDQLRTERIETLKDVKKEVTLSYRKAMENAELFVMMLDNLKDEGELMSTYNLSKSFHLLHNLRYEIINIEDQKLELEVDDDLEIINEIDELLILMKQDHQLLEEYSNEILMLKQHEMSKEEFKNYHGLLIRKIEKVEVKFVDKTERSIVLKIQEKIKSL